MRENRIKRIEDDWKLNPRWSGIKRPYTAEQVVNLQGSRVFDLHYSRMIAHKLWQLLQDNDYIHTLGALTGMQALQQEIGRAHV